ncbi:hypothetical protein HMPREF0322_03786 [Desulfitobacterium hafniense DP7]|uniref:Uncharacterized protein n=2 Tax=Desulfitobacterium hafniense TaxID=49338 RepID=A0A0W1JHS8_DESHA|nr:DUF6884 domain-containing protein [Desulfitobacterium hafniense]EHL05566.1 hypothetical protein HMPREF0322_03786 [Desulfitobacterium hafniense DP7]KTE90623.1 hypothetical protein AT727_08520 [Desulfitobacterium hafniense]
MQKVVLISCSKAKRSVPCAARLLYDASNLFRKSLAYAQTISNDIYVISSKYGLVPLDEVIAPYDDTLNDKSAAELAAWGQRIVEQIRNRHDISNTEFVILAGKNYYYPLQKYLPNITLPLRGMQIGPRLAKLDSLLVTGNKPKQSTMCGKLHELFNSMPRFRWNTIDSISFNSGIYIVFEDGEKYHHLDRIVRVGTHRSDGRLRGRLKDHFLRENKDGSIFRKNIGKAILNKNNHPYLSAWSMNTSKPDIVAQLGNRYDPVFQENLEQQISSHIRKHFSFVYFPVSTEAERLRLEEGIIATLNASPDFVASPEWRGQYSPEREIMQSGLWLKEGLNGMPLSEVEYRMIESYCQGIRPPASKIDDAQSISPPSTATNSKTADVARYIEEKLIKARAAGATSLIVKSGEIHKELDLVSRMPTVCGAMRKLIKTGDKVLHAPPSGNGATLTIEYFL